MDEIVQYVTISYSIRLIESSVRRVVQQIKIDKRDMSFSEDYIALSFQIADLNTPDACELSLQTLIFNFTDLPPFKILAMLSVW